MKITQRCLALSCATATAIVLSCCPSVSAQTTTGASHYDRLADEATAAALALTDEQKAAVSTIVAEREAALAAAADEDAKAAAQAAAQEKLAAVLTEEQQTQFAALFETPRIKFNFRFQKWSDVLPWIAGEAGLSLVMAEAPEGTFNYSDRREYEPDEAIDLLNGWLMIKGFTLIRRDQLLLCISLKDGIPDGTVPRVPLDELPQRGRFEFVSVLIPLENREPATVMTEVEPLASEWGEVRPLTATKQLLVTDAADIVRTIHQVAMAVPPPKAAPPPPQQPPAPKPVLTTYPISHPNPAAAVDLLKQFVSGTIVLDETASQISINAVPAQQALAVTLMKQLEENQGPDRRPELKSYPVRTDNPEQMLQSLQLAVPAAAVRYDPAARRLVVFASAQDHQRLMAAMLELENQAGVREEQLSVHPLKDIDPAVVQQLIGSVLPDVRVTVDPRTSTLIAVGRLSELRAVQTLVDQLQPEAASIGTSVLQSYAVPSELVDMANAVIGSIVPDATVTPDAANDRLLIVAQPRDHESIAATLDQLKQDIAAGGVTLKSYDAEGISYSSVSPLLQALVPAAQLIDDSAGRRLMAIASAEDHEQISNVLEQVRDDPEAARPALRFYPLRDDFNEQQFTALMSSFGLEASLSIDHRNSRLMVTASTADHQRITELLDQLTPEVPPEKPQLKPYRLPEQIDTETFISMLKSVASQAAVQVDSANDRLLITATAADHEAAQQLLEQLTSDLPDAEKQLKTYALPGQISSATVTSMLQALAPEASVVIDSASERIIVTATGEQQATVRATLEQLGSEVSPKRLQLRTFPLPDGTTADTVTTLLTPVAPQATVTVDVVGKRILITATEDDFAVIGPMLEELSGEQQWNQQLLKSYPLKADIEPSTVTTLLSSLTPEASVTTDAEGHRLLIRASSANHESIESAIAQITRDARGELPQLQYYPLERADGQYAVTVLSAIVTDATIRHEPEMKRLSVIASQSDHQTIQQTLTKLEAAAPEQEKRALKVYSVTKTQRARFDAVLQGLTEEIPGLQVLSGGEPGELIIWAKPSHHEIVDSMLAQLDRKLPQDQQPSLVVYPIAKVEAESVAEVLREIFPDATINVDSRASRVLVRARPAMQSTIKSAIQQLDAEIPPGQEIKLMVYPVKGLNADTALSLINQEVPEVTIIRDQTAQTFIIRGQLEQHQAVAELLDTLRSSTVGKHVPVVYPTDHSDPNQLREVLERAWPDALIVADDRARTLMVLATPEDQAHIRKTMDQLSAAGADAGPRAESKVYSLRGIPSAELRSLLAESVPRARVVVANDQLLAWAQPDDQAVIQRIVAGLNNHSEDLTVTAFDISRLDVTTVQSILSTVAPRTTFHTGRDGRALIASVDDATKAAVESALAELEESPAARQEQTLKFYAVDKSTASSVQSVLSSAVPEVSLLLSSDGTQLFARVTEDQHARIEATLAQLAAEKPFETNRTLQMYSTTKSGPNTTGVLQRMVPAAVINTGSEPGQLMIEATDLDHQQISQLITQLEEAAGDSDRQLRFYDVDPATLASTQTTLATVVPDVALTSSTDGTRLFAQVTGEQHEKIVQTLEQLAAEQPFRSNRILKFYAAGKAGSGAASVLQRLVPSAVISTGPRSGQLMVEATQAQHEDIDKLLKQIIAAAGDVHRSVRFYAVDETSPENTRSVVAAVIPEVSFTVSADNTRLIAVVSDAQHARIISVLRSLAEERPFQSNRLLKFYSTAGAGSDPLSVLQRMVPSALINNGSQPDQLMIEGTAAEHDEVASLLASLKEAAEDGTRTLRFYDVNRDQLLNAREIVAEAVSGLDIRTSSDGTRLIALVTAEQDEKISTVLEQLASAAAGGPRKTTTVFDITGTDPDAIRTALEPFMAGDGGVRITVDATSKRVYVHAFEDRQEDIREAITQIMAGVTEGAETQVATYFVGDGNGDEAEEALSALYPDATIVSDRSRRLIIATATPEQQETIRLVAEQMQNAVAMQTDVTPRTYETVHLDASWLESVLRNLFPRDRDFTVSVNPESGQLVALAKEAQHETIRQLLQEADRPPELTAKTVRIYQTAPLTPATVMTALRPLVSRHTTISPEQNGEEIIVSAPAAEHTKIAELLQQMGISPDPAEKSLAVYRVAPLDTSTVISALQPLISRHVTLSPERSGQEIVVSAPPDEQAKIAKLVQQLKSHHTDADGVQIRSYHVGRGKADDAISVLGRMLPDATLVTDRRSETLVATALPEQHQTIAEVVRQMTGQGDDDNQPAPRSYLLRQYDGRRMIELLEDTFSAADDVRVTWDDRNKRVIAVARPTQHDIIAGIISELDPKDGPYIRHLRFYPLQNLDLASVDRVISGVVRNLDPGGSVAVDYQGESLMVTTNDRGHLLVKEALARFQPTPPRRLRIFQLSFMDPWEAMSAIDRMIVDRIPRLHLRPDVHADDNLQQLWVRGTERQLKEIEQLLVQLGEVSLAGAGRAETGPNLRVIPVGEDVQGALRRIEDLWPRIRTNPIRVLDPASTPDQQGEEEPIPGQFSVPPEDTRSSGSRTQNREQDAELEKQLRAADPNGLLGAAVVPETAAEQPSTDESSPHGTLPPSADFDGTDPVIIIPGNGKITIASDDTDALNQLESLLRTIYARGSTGLENRDFSVRQLQNTAAADVSATIRHILEETEGIAYFGDVAVVPEERLNALIVYGDRSDRRRLDPLLEILDSEKIDSSRAYQTKLLPLKYSSATRIEDILKSIYKVQMTAGGRRASMGIPSGVPSEVATVLRQINAAASSPLLIIEIQRETNSLILKAPPDLLNEVTELAMELDEAALTKRANGVTLLPLKKSSSRRVMEILSRVLN